MDFSGLTLREKVAQTVVCLHTGKDSAFVEEPIGGVFMGAQVITEVKDDDGVETMRQNLQKYLNSHVHHQCILILQTHSAHISVFP